MAKRALDKMNKEELKSEKNLQKRLFEKGDQCNKKAVKSLADVSQKKQQTAIKAKEKQTERVRARLEQKVNEAGTTRFPLIIHPTP